MKSKMQHAQLFTVGEIILHERSTGCVRVGEDFVKPYGFWWFCFCALHSRYYLDRAISVSSPVWPPRMNC